MSLYTVWVWSKRKLKKGKDFNIVCNGHKIQSKCVNMCLIPRLNSDNSCRVNLLPITFFSKLMLALSFFISTVTVYLQEKPCV